MAVFFIFYAPFIVVMASLAAAFWLAPMDNIVKK